MQMKWNHIFKCSARWTMAGLEQVRMGWAQALMSSHWCQGAHCPSATVVTPPWILWVWQLTSEQPVSGSYCPWLGPAFSGCGCGGWLKHPCELCGMRNFQVRISLFKSHSSWCCFFSLLTTFHALPAVWGHSWMQRDCKYSEGFRIQQFWIQTTFCVCQCSS